MNTIPHMVRRAADDFGSLEALVDGDRRWTFTELHRDVRRSAGAFVAAGLAHGDRIAIWAPNSAEWMIAALGAQYVGGVLVPINTRFKGHEAADLLARSRARFLVVDHCWLEMDGARVHRLADLLTARPDGASVVLLGARFPARTLSPHWARVCSILAEDRAVRLEVA